MPQNFFTLIVKDRVFAMADFSTLANVLNSPPLKGAPLGNTKVLLANIRPGRKCVPQTILLGISKSSNSFYGRDPWER